MGKRLDFLVRRRQADEIKRDAAQECMPVGLVRRRDSLAFEPLEALRSSTYRHTLPVPRSLETRRLSATELAVRPPGSDEFISKSR